MRTASARADDRGVGVGDVHRLRDFSDLHRSELGLDLLNEEFFVQPSGQARLGPPRVGNRVLTEPLGNPSSLRHSLWLRVANQRRSCHVVA